MFHIKPNKIPSTSFSNFIRNASAAEKKRVYAGVLQRATERQNKVLTEQQSRETGS